MNEVKQAGFKFAFTGTNSSGKTTIVHDLTARLKMNNVLVEAVTSQDRKSTWDFRHCIQNYHGHYGLMTGLIRAEVEAELKGDADVVLVDRSILDLYSIAITDHPDKDQISKIEEMVLQWASSYTAIYYLEPLQYVDDGVRPSDDFRMRTHANLVKLMENPRLTNLVRIPRHKIMKDIAQRIGLDLSKPMLQAEKKWQQLSNVFNVRLAVKEAQWSGASSDIDVFVLSPTPIDVSPIQVAAEQYFGQPVDALLVVDESELPRHALYTPEAK